MPKVAKELKPGPRADPLAHRTAATKGKAKSTENLKGGTTNAAAKKTQSSSGTKSSKGGLRRNPNQKNLLLLARLRGTEDPTITRLLSVPANLTFEQFHDVMQIAFGWANCHMYTFNVEKAPEQEDVDDGGSEDGGWPVSIMTIMREPDDYGTGTPSKDASKMTLEDLYYAEGHEDGVGLLYEYDMGDGWEHDVIFVGVENSSTRKLMMIPSELPIVCLAGEGHPCAEDVGSIPGWEDLKEIFAKPRSRDPDGRKDWYKKYCANGDPKGLDPYKWDIFKVNDKLHKYAKTIRA